MDRSDSTSSCSGTARSGSLPNGQGDPAETGPPPPPPPEPQEDTDDGSEIEGASPVVLSPTVPLAPPSTRLDSSHHHPHPPSGSSPGTLSRLRCDSDPVPTERRTSISRVDALDPDAILAATLADIVVADAFAGAVATSETPPCDPLKEKNGSGPSPEAVTNATMPTLPTPADFQHQRHFSSAENVDRVAVCSGSSRGSLGSYAITPMNRADRASTASAPADTEVTAAVPTTAIPLMPPRCSSVESILMCTYAPVTGDGVVVPVVVKGPTSSAPLQLAVPLSAMLEPMHPPPVPSCGSFSYSTARQNFETAFNGAVITGGGGFTGPDGTGIGGIGWGPRTSSCAGFLTKSWRIFTLFGLPVKMHYSFPPVIVIMFIWYSIQQPHDFWILYASLQLLMLLVSSLIHELGHMYAAKSVGGEVNEILLWPLGGFALNRHCGHPCDQIKISAFGPLTHIPFGVLFGVLILFLNPGFTLMLQIPLWKNVVVNSFIGCLLVQVVLFLFNVFVPCYPLDGGQILASMLLLRFDRNTAAKVMVWFSLPFIALMVLMSYTSFLTPAACIVVTWIIFEDYRLYVAIKHNLVHEHPFFCFYTERH